MKTWRNLVPRNQAFRWRQKCGLADGILPRPEAACERVIHDDGVRSVGLVMVIEEASPKQRNTHRLEVIAGDGAILDICNLLNGSRQRTVKRHKMLSPGFSSKRQTGNCARGFDPGKLLDPWQ